MGELPFDFVAINRVHDDDVIWTVYAQECGLFDSLPCARKKLADAVGIDIDHVLDLS